MFMQSFENSDKQQQRRWQRQLAMQRMEEAANLIPGEDDDDEAAGGAPGTAAAGRQGSQSMLFEDTALQAGGESDGLDDGLNDGLNGGDLTRDPSSSLGQGTSELNNQNELKSINELNNMNDGTTPVVSNPKSHNLTTSARNFIRDCQQEAPAIHVTAVSTTLHHLESTSAKQFLWDSSADDRSSASKSINLHDIKHSLSRHAGGSASSIAGSIAGSIASGNRHFGGYGRIRSGLWNALPLWGGGQSQSYSQINSKYRDEEGERLLSLASERLASPSGNKNDRAKDPAVVNMTPMQMAHVDQEYGDSADDANGKFSGNDYDDDDDHMNDQRSVFIDEEGNLQYSDNAAQFRRKYYKHLIVRGRCCATNAKGRRPLMTACALVVGVVILLAFAFSSSNLLQRISPKHGNLKLHDPFATMDDDQALLEPTLPSSINATRFNMIKSHLLRHQVSTEGSLRDTRSAQYAALTWLVRDDKRQLNTESPFLGQRYGLAVLWFSSTETEYEWHVPEEYIKGGKDSWDDVNAYIDESADEGTNVAANDSSNESSDETSIGSVDKDDIIGDADNVGDESSMDDYYDSSTEAQSQDNYDWESVTAPSSDTELDQGTTIHGPRRKRQRQRRQLLPSKHRQTQDPNTLEWKRSDGWLTEIGVCGWEGVKCHPRGNGTDHDDDADGDVSHLELSSNNMHGLIPKEVFTSLPYLKFVDMSNNGFTGTISSEIGKLSILEHLNVTSNHIGGSIPFDIGTLSRLKVFHMANNLISESIPPSIGNLNKLRDIDLSTNTLMGTIPSEIAQLRELTSLNLSNNFILGTIPSTINQMEHLITLHLSHNNLGGGLPPNLAEITYLQTLRLDNNYFEGPLPAEIGNLKHLDELYLNDNNFWGELPYQFSMLVGLDHISVANNHFGGYFPATWTDLAGLQSIDLSGNNIIGEVPPSIFDMTNLRSVNFSFNDLSGPIPSELGSLFKLEYIYLENNEFNGAVPKELGELIDLKILSLHNNDLEGYVPDEICRLSTDMFLARFTTDCAGVSAMIFCDCCQCNYKEHIVYEDNDSP